MTITGPTTPPGACYRQDGDHDTASAERSDDNEGHRRGHFDISSRDVCVGESSQPTIDAIRSYALSFLQTLFSTDIVKYQDGLEESYSPLALERWFTVTIPLTVVTFALAAVWLTKDSILAYIRRREAMKRDVEKAD
jgi:hypothetical protein